MVAIASLWLPIVLAAVAVFIVSSLIHTVLGYHWNDYRSVPKQEAAQDALRGLNLAPGDYFIPRTATAKQMRSPEYKALVDRGPVAMLSIWSSGFEMGKSLLQWFIYLLVVGFCCAYLAGRELHPGSEYLSVFRIVGFTAFMAYSLALPQASIWYRRNWRMTIVTMIDGLIYACVTAGVFGWLWPK
jgi:hypothetical protein